MKSHESAAAYFVGGVTLCGKSQTLGLVRKALEAENPELRTLDTDGLRSVLWANTTPETVPGLWWMFQNRERFEHETDWLNEARTNPATFINASREQSHEVWGRGVVPYLRCNLDRGLSTVVEGIATLPEDVATLPYAHKAVFLVNKNPDSQLPHVLADIAGNDRHWARAWSQEKVETYLRFVTLGMSELVEQSAEMHGYDCIDMSVGNFGDRQREAVQLLMLQDMQEPAP